MNVTGNIKRKIQNWFWARELVHLRRVKSPMSFEKVKSVGILYDATNEADYTQITHLVRKLQFEQKVVRTLGYVSRKKMPDYCFPKLTFEFYNLKEFNWLLKSNNSFIKEFISTEFDLLIDFTPSDCFYQKYIASVSAAHFKVGRRHPDQEKYYDFMIEVPENYDLDQLIEQTLFYLRLINNQ